MPKTTPPPATGHVAVFGKCPCCGERELYLNEGGFVTCLTHGCLLSDVDADRPLTDGEIAELVTAEAEVEARFERLLADHRSPDGAIECDGHVLLTYAVEALSGRLKGGR